MANSADVPRQEGQDSEPDDSFLVFNRKDRVPLPQAMGSVASITRSVVELKADAYRALLTVFAERTNKQVNYLDHVRAIVDRKTKRLLLIPEEAEGEDTAALRNSASTHRIGLSRILARARLTVEKGYTEVYPAIAETHPRFGRVLVIDLAVLLDRRTGGKRLPKSSGGEPSHS